MGDGFRQMQNCTDRLFFLLQRRMVPPDKVLLVSPEASARGFDLSIVAVNCFFVCTAQLFLSALFHLEWQLEISLRRLSFVNRVHVFGSENFA